MRDNLQQVVRRAQPPGLVGGIEGAVLVAHGAGGDAHGAIVQRADQRVGLDRQRRLRKLLWEAPDLPAAGNRRMVVEEHLVCVAADFAIERSEEHTSELQSLMRISYAVFCLKKKKIIRHQI